MRMRLREEKEDIGSRGGVVHYGKVIFFISSLLAKKVNLAMLIPAWFYVRNAI